ncbi:MAG: LysR substrate-binding domain-containing protein [Hyphomicrobiaceae bacterium]|nr:LysR substrate-binding domain-containing protein [Hyphomicrobiaceae bacterium]
MISLKQLRYFEAVARHGHFGKAAEHCAISQPALSMQIQDLEQELGLKLIERRAKGAVLTEPGKEVARRAARILGEVRDLADYASQCGQLLSGPLRLGVIPTIAPYLLPRLLAELRTRHPHLELHVRETQTSVLVAELDHGQLDVLVLALPVDAPELETLPLMEDRFLLAMPKGRRPQAKVRASPELIKNDRLLLLEEGHCLREQALTYCSLRQVNNIDTFGASSLATLVQMVANGMGLTLLPEIAVAQECTRGDIALIRFEEPQPTRTIGLAWRATSPRRRDFVELGRLIVATSGRARKG